MENGFHIPISQRPGGSIWQFALSIRCGSIWQFALWSGAVLYTDMTICFVDQVQFKKDWVWMTMISLYHTADL